MIIRKIHPHEWPALSENAHLVVFGTHKPASRDRIDYALLAQEGEKLCGYIAVREHDSETAYWQFGGTFPDARGTVLSFRAYQAALRWTKEQGYKRVSLLVANDNGVMLKFAATTGFKIIGTKHLNGRVLLDHLLDFGEN